MALCGAFGSFRTRAVLCVLLHFDAMRNARNVKPRTDSIVSRNGNGSGCGGCGLWWLNIYEKNVSNVRRVCVRVCCVHDRLYGERVQHMGYDFG